MLLILGLLIALHFSLGSSADAGGIFGRWRTNANRTPARVQQQQPSYQRAASPQTWPTRNLDQGRSRLPSGRSYYQGRYYGNFNNRFYGPQYGYF